MKTDRDSIFSSYTQILDVDMSTVTPIYDRLIVRDLPDEDKIGSLYKPDNVATGAGKGGNIRIGIVVACGPGDPTIEHVPEHHAAEVRRTRRKCHGCKGDGWVYGAFVKKHCTECNGTGAGRLPMEVKVGMKILYDRRRESEFFVGGQRYGIINEEQSCFAILED